jgi:AcrR family transcriptional regulator
METERKPYHHGRLRETLVDAALELARTGGPEAVVLRAVSREAGVSHNAAYRHFADHDELLSAVADRCMDALGRLMARRAAAVPVADPAELAWARLDVTGRAYIEFAVTEPGWFRTAFGASPAPEGPVAVELGEIEPGPYELLSGCLDELVATGALPPERRPGAETAAWAMVHGLATLLVDGPLRHADPALVEPAMAAVLAVVRRGL